MMKISRHSKPSAHSHRCDHPLHPRGFSFVELLIGVTILAIISVTAYAYAFDASEREQVQQTRLRMADIGEKVDGFSRDSGGELPEDIVQLMSEDVGKSRLLDRELRDAWGREVIYEKIGDGEFELVSAGPDGVDGNADDVRMRF